MPGNRPARHRVLVIDDDRDIRDSIRDLLELEGYEVDTAEHGRAALELLNRSSAPCLILLDLMMPVMNGWQFLDAIRREEKLPSIKHVPVAVVSALDQAAALKNTYECEVFKKPIDIDRLLQTARHYCAAC